MEPIAIIGMSCRLPGGVQTPDQLWQILRDGIDAIAEAPPEREELYRAYDPDAEPTTAGKVVTLQGGFLKDVDGFDAAFFDITPREAVRMDPQQRLLLEVAWESLEDAGWTPPALVGRQVGVFMGMWTNDYQNTLYQSLDDIDLYATTGTGHYAASGHVSYHLDLRGPSMTIDTACSSSLVAIHLACQSLRTGECDLALAGGTNLILQPHLSIGYSRSKMLSPDGRCKFGDEWANGYVRSEGVAVIVLKPLSVAQADRDHIYAVICSSGVNNDGKSSNSLVKPGFESQESLIRAVYHKAGVSADEIDYVEAHGTGTSLGDEVELRAIGAAVSSTGRARTEPCYVGSMKTNIGHTESASGVAGVIKLALSLQHRLIPPSLHFKTPQSRVPWSQLPIAIPCVLTPWPRKAGAAYASINSYGVTGTNAHVLLREAPAPAQRLSTAERPYHLLTLSARSPRALRQLAEAYRHYLREHREDLDLGDMCYTTHIGRAHFEHRLALVADTLSEIEQQLDALLNESKTEAGVFSVSDKGEEGKTGVAFFFPAQSNMYPGMACQLYESEPTFRRQIDYCTALAGRYLDRPMALLSAHSIEEALLIDDMPVRQAATFALQYALACMWQSWGITPQAVCGEGLGMYVAACVTGGVKLEEALRLCIEHAQFRQAEQTAAPVASPGTAVSSQIERMIEQANTMHYWVSQSGQDPLYQQSYKSLEASIQALHQQACVLCIEMGAGSSEEHPAADLPLLPALRAGFPDWKQTQLVLGACYVRHVCIDWRAFEASSPYRCLPLPTYAFQHERYRLAPVASTPSPQEPSEFLHDLLLALPSQRHRIIQEHVHSLVAITLGYGTEATLDPRRGFWELGMTSLMTVELHQRLQAATGRPLLPTLLFDYPTIESVSNYLARELSLPTRDEALAFTNAVTEQNLPKKRDDGQGDQQQQVQCLSEEAAAALLADELAGLEEDIRHI